MKRSETMAIGDVMRMVLDECCMSRRLDELHAADVWSRVVGDYIAANTSRPAVRGSLMTVGVPNAAMRQELGMSRSAIIREINRLLGKDIISEIRFIS
ncbi:MAG: DUF721 domain-containing protein [Muribaculaceae bacterium]|nr:DUF721 domain-containing protein [Muribaculaceae bacterium]MDE6842055.1 DUF721 domain-containing protein [Muribaculaceae bacterium]MDE7190001.1 DUF721 domain-containing protein [Muribaculaceae bacterium]